MKRCLLIALALFMFCKPVWAIDVNDINKLKDKLIIEYTIEEAYIIYNMKFPSLINKTGSLADYYNGFLDGASLKYLRAGHNITDCINRPLAVWFDLIFDKYKLDKVKGRDYFQKHFIKSIEDVCNISITSRGDNLQPVEVEDIIDGDTVKVLYDGKKINVRLLDIDCYETSVNPRAKWQSEYYKKSLDEVLKQGNQSKEILQQLISLNKYFVYLKPKGEDKYGRTLGWLYIGNEEQSINDYMLTKGKCEKYIPRK